MNRTIGILAHVDAGKTTLCEQLLYQSGARRTLGRVDHQTALLDFSPIERRRGITIFSEQAVINWQGEGITLVDAPGHWEFAPEMERVLRVLDCAVLVISATAGIQANTKALWRLLEQQQIPTVFFINKTDAVGADPEGVLQQLRQEFTDDVCLLEAPWSDEAWEQVAMLDDETLEAYLSGTTDEAHLLAAARTGVAKRRLFPVFCGSALQGNGIENLLDGICRLVRPEYDSEGTLRARAYKVRHDAQGARVTFLKILSGTLRPKQLLAGEKVNELRQYQAERFEPISQVGAGRLCAVTGLSALQPGDEVGCEISHQSSTIMPVIGARVLLPEGLIVQKALADLRLLEQEEPTLHVRFQPGLNQLEVDTMGPIQLEVLTELVKDRFGWDIAFGEPEPLYRETILNSVIGIGHYEPLKHYAEAHLRLSPGAPGSGITFESRCHTDDLALSWQRLIETHVLEKEHVGPLIGAPLTDVRVTLLAGRSHLKHTEGGDFRQATYRAIRQGLFQAQCQLLEPWYRFEIQAGNDLVGRLLSDLSQLGAETDLPQTVGKTVRLTGRCSVSKITAYAQKIPALSRGEGSILLEFDRYAPCQDAEAVIARRGYDRQRDVENSADSVFCSHGAGFTVKWDQVAQYAHISIKER